MAEPRILTRSKDVLELIKSQKEVTIKFRKKTGNKEDRVMRCTLDFSRIPEPDQPKNVNLPKILKLMNNQKILHVYDINRTGWRSVNLDTSEWIDIPPKEGEEVPKRFLINIT